MSDKQSLGTLVSGVTEDLSALVRGEIELAKTELRDSARTAGKGTGLLVGAGVLLGSTILRDPIGKLFAGDYEVTGTWVDGRQV